jgi:hypothetical protein
MALRLSQVAANLYEATVTPPHSVSDWRTPTPLSGRQLLKALVAMGCHQQDIGDALYDVDPDWLSKLEPSDG